MAESLVISIIDKLKDPVLNEVYFLRSVGRKVDSVREKLEWIKSFLRDAESRSNEEEVFKLWVEKIREVAYRIEDAVDIYIVEIKGDRFVGSCLTARVKWIFYKSRIMKLAALHRLGAELDDIEQTLKEIKENRESFKVDDLVEGGRGKAKLPMGLALPKYHHEGRIVGLETDREAIVRKLLDTQNPLKVISIVGTGGLGKTTLAREVFNSAEVKGNFDILIWLTVSQEFEISSILKKMLAKIRKIEEEEKDRDAEYFADEISKSLKKKRFLIVLDDVWSETFWPDIRAACPPHNAINCGRVVITTRDLKVAQKAQSEPYQLKFLNIEESKLLLYKVSFPEQEPPKGLDPVATEIAEKCGGLPLAIVVVGGGLYMEHTSSQWRKVAERMDWSGCMKILSTSYDDMPSVLKTCFMYLASFPEDELIDALSLIRMWVADDVVPDEETGDECLQQLAQRCLIIVRATSYDGSVVEFRVHDLLLKLAIDKAKESKFLSVFTKQNPDQISFSNARRASLQSCTFSKSSSNFQKYKKTMRNYNRKLRFLLVSGESLPDCLEFRLLKVLKVDSCDISFSQLEKICEQLIHLRHLELRNCFIETSSIPKTIGHLKNLLTLDCSGTWIVTLPDSLWTITTLRHAMFNLVLRDSPRAPLPSASLSNLKILGNIAFESLTETNRFPPNCFPNLHELTIYYDNPWIVTMLEELNQLVTLKISWSWHIQDNVVFDMSALPFYQKLQCLHLSGQHTFSAAVPYYFDCPKSFWPPNLTELALSELRWVKDPMADLGKLRNLEILVLGYCDFKQKKVAWIFSDGSFPQLQQLTLYDLRSAVKEFSIALGAMPQLKKFHMAGFYELNNILELQHLRKLQGFEWTHAPFTEEQIQAIQQENQHKIHHILSFRIESMYR